MNQTRKRGFTLIEAVVAVAIMSVSVFALLAAASRCLAIARTARSFHTAAAVLDQGELEHPYVATNDIADIELEPVDYDNGFTFARAVEPLEGEDDMFVVRTRVSWSAKGRHVFEETERLLFTTNHP